MINSLKSKYDLPSMNYNQIIELLGENGVAEESGKGKIIYYIGKGTMNPSIFWIDFNKDGNVTSIGEIIETD